MRYKEIVVMLLAMLIVSLLNHINYVKNVIQKQEFLKLGHSTLSSPYTHIQTDGRTDTHTRCS